MNSISLKMEPDCCSTFANEFNIMPDSFSHLPSNDSPFIHIIRWSKIWGCMSVSYNKDLNRWDVSPFYCFWVVCFIGFNIPCFYDCISTSIADDNSLTLYVMILIVGVMSISAISTHALVLIQHKDWAYFMNHWMIFEQKFPTLTVGVYSRTLPIPLFIGFFLCVCFFIINIFNELRFNLINEDGVGRMLSLVYVYVIYSYTLSTPILWIIMTSKIICLCLSLVKQELDAIIMSIEGNFSCTSRLTSKCITIKDMEYLKEAILEITRVIESFKRLMGPVMLVITPHHIISLICFLYWTFVSLLDYSDWYFPLSFGLLSLQAIAPIFIGAIYSENVHDKVGYSILFRVLW